MIYVFQVLFVLGVLGNVAFFFWQQKIWNEINDGLLAARDDAQNEANGYRVATEQLKSKR